MARVCVQYGKPIVAIFNNLFQQQHPIVGPRQANDENPVMFC